MTGRKRWVNAHDVDFPAGHRPTRSIFPGEDVAIVRISPDSGKKESLVVKFGLVPSWTDNPNFGKKNAYNARGETLATKPSFAEPFLKRRCIIPTDAFYEWAEGSDGKKSLYKFTRTEGDFPFAGLWEHNQKLGITSCTIITSAPNPEVAKTGHDRTPVILAPSQFAAWLNPTLSEPAALTPFLEPYKGLDFVIAKEK